MCRMQSLHSQCCCCACSVFSALFGILMASTGVCLVLNYGILEVDTGGLPPELHNEEGKKIVGIILISVGLTAIAISALVSILYYAVCSRTKPPQVAALNVPPNQNGATSTKSKHKPKNKAIQNLQNSARVSGQQNLAPPSSRHGKRHKRKNFHYQTRLSTHREENDDPSYVVRFQGENVTISSNQFMNTNNHSSAETVPRSRTPGTSEVSSTSSSCDNIDSTVKSPVIICVDSLSSEPCDSGISAGEAQATPSVSSSDSVTQINTISSDVERCIT